MPAESPLIPVMVVTIAVGTMAAFLAWRERPEPGATPLVAMFLGQSWWAAFFVFELQASTLATKTLWSDVQWLGVVVIPVGWLLFALEYTGRDRYLRPRYLLAVAVVPTVTVALAMTDRYHELLYTGSTLVEGGGTVMLDRTGGPWYWVVTGYTYLLGVLGAVPMLALVRRDAVPFRGQSAAILVGTVTPGIANLLFLAGLVPVPAFDPTPIAFSISGIAFLGAISRFRLFGTSPSPNRRARRLIFERMQEGAVVVDSHDYVVDMNGRAADILDVSRREVLGSPAADLLPEYDRYPADGQMADPVTVHAESCPRSLDVAVTAITDIHGQSIGRLVSLHDIGEYLRQQQRLEVLHRVLRHNIRTETNLIYGYADRPTGDGQSEAARVKEHAMRIEEIGRKSRTIIELFDREHDEPEPVALDALLERTVRSVREEYPGVTITRDTVADSVQVAGVLEAVFENVVENAAEHNTASDPRVWVDAEVDGERVQVTVGDNGPGIDDHERAVLKRGTETPLEHGSGLGLWLVKWGTDIVGGQVTFAQNDPTGTVITLELPVLSRPVGVEGESDSGATAD